MQAQWLTAAQASAGSVLGPTVTLVPNTWTRLSITGAVASATAATLRVDIDAGDSGTIAWPASSRLDASGLLIERGSTLGTFFNGETANTGTLSTTSWPEVTPAPYSLEDPAASDVSWHVYIDAVSLDRSNGTANIDVATFETVLSEIVNMGEPWLPVGFVQVGYAAGDVLVQLLRYAGVSAPVEVSVGTIIPFDRMAPWQPGESAWEWWDRVRVAGELGYSVDPATGIFSVRAAQTATGAVPAAVIEHSEEYGASLSESATYADSLTVMWKWSEIEGGELVERVKRDVAYAAGLDDWRDARRHMEIERVGPPVKDYAQRAVNNLNRFRVVHEVTVPLTPVLLASALGQEWQVISYNFSETPSVTLTILTS